MFCLDDNYVAACFYTLTPAHTAHTHTPMWAHTQTHTHTTMRTRTHTHTHTHTQEPDTEDNTSDESHTIPSHTQHNTSPSQSSEQMSFKSTRSQTRQTEIPVKSSSSCLKKPNPVNKKEGNYVTNQTGSSSSPPTHTRVATSAEDQKTKNKLLKDSRRRPGTEMRNKNVVSVKVNISYPYYSCSENGLV